MCPPGLAEVETAGRGACGAPASGKSQDRAHNRRSRSAGQGAQERLIAGYVLSKVELQTVITEGLAAGALYEPGESLVFAFFASASSRFSRSTSARNAATSSSFGRDEGPPLSPR